MDSHHGGVEAKKVVFNGSPQNVLVPSQQSLASFSAGQPVSFFTGIAGVGAGTDSFVTRRWKGKGGGRRWGPGVQSSSGAVSFGKVFGPVAGGAETDLSDAQFCGAVAVPSGPLLPCRQF